MDVRLLIKRKMKIRKTGGEWIWVTFKYEHIPNFCFFCGLIGHTNKLCEKMYDYQREEPNFMWGECLMASFYRSATMEGEKWLRDAPPSMDFGEGDGEANRIVVDLECTCKESEGISGTKNGDRGAKCKKISLHNHGKIILSQLVEGIVEEKIMGGQNFENNEGVIIVDLKRRRFDDELGVAIQLNGSSQSMDADVANGPKNLQEAS